MTKLAIFDLNDTLVDNVGAIDRWFVELAGQRALGSAGLAFLRAEQHRPVSPEESLRAIVDHFGFAESPADLQRILGQRLPQLARRFDGVLTGLRAIRSSGWRTALLTNGFAEQQRAKLGDGLEDLFDVLYFADDEGIRKPDPAAYRLVADRCGCEPERAWMVGDSLEYDLAGAVAARMSTIWVSGGARLPEDGPRPDLIVDTIAEVFPILTVASDGRAVVPHQGSVLPQSTDS